MNTVMVTKFLPSSTGSGGQQRSFAFLERLAALGPSTVCCFDDGSADLREVSRLGVEVRTVPWSPSLPSAVVGALRTRALTSGRFWSRRLSNAVHEAALPGVDLLQVEHLQMVPYASGVRARLRVLDLHNIESDLVGSYAATLAGARALPFVLEARALRRMERDAVRVFDLVSVVSQRDRDLLPRSRAPAIVCANGWTPQEALPVATAPVAAFVATMSWAPNADAARWLGHVIWPKVRQRLPEACLVLVGRDPTPDVRGLEGRGVHVAGTVSSTEPYLRRCRVALAPLRSGGGSRLKILEALGAGRPVVATRIGASGLEDLVGEGVVVCDDPDEMAESIVWLLQDADAGAELGRRGHRAVTERYGWDQTLAPLIERIL